MSTSVKLSAPLLTHKGQIDTIDLKEPTAKSFIEHGEPFRVTVKDGTVNVDFFNKSMAGFLFDMTGIDVLLLQGLAAKDYMTLRTRAVDMIMGLVGDDPVPTSAA